MTHEAAAGSLLYLSRKDIESLAMAPVSVIEAVSDALHELGAGRAEMPPKPGIHPLPDAFIHAMPAFLPTLGAAGIKWVSGFPANPAAGLPYISGLLVLNDPQTGFPICVMDATWITAVRTGAATAIAAKRLAREDSRTMAILGCGVQGRSNLQCLLQVLPGLSLVRAYDLSREAARAYAEWARSELGIQAEVQSTARAAVEGADIVVTAGPILQTPSPVLEDTWLAPGVFCCALDFDSYVTPRAMSACDRIFTDDLSQLEFYRKAGYFAKTPPVRADLGMLLTGKASGRTNAQERILCLNLGLAVEDLACAIRLYERARMRGVGTTLAL